MRDAKCPICQRQTEVRLRLGFGQKMQLPTQVELRYCGQDNFLFLAGGRQCDYDHYYAAVANDSYHQEVSVGTGSSPISRLQKEQLLSAVGDFFAVPRKVLDFGCGEAALLLELASNFRTSAFYGFEPSPAAHTASRKATMLALDNCLIASLEESSKRGPFDLVIASQVVEHLLDLDLINPFHGCLADGGLLYIEVPNALRYGIYERLEFLYYFDRLHVNHFTPQALSRLATGYGFGYLKHFEYAFPYRDGGEYPALGMLFRKGGDPVNVVSPNLLEKVNHYIGREKERARKVAALLEAFEGVLVWGAGDNFYRSIGEGGPLAGLHQMVLLDRRPHEVTIGSRTYQAIDPQSGIRKYSWPVVLTISEGRKEISRQVAEIDPDRRILFL